MFFISRTDFASTVTTYGYSDGIEYLSLAQKLVNERAFVDRFGTPYVHRPPGYPAFLAALLVLTNQNVDRALMVQAIVISFGVLVLYWLARRILPPVIAFTGTLLVAFSPWGIPFAGLPVSDGLFLAVLALIFFTTKLAEDAGSLAWAILAGAFTGLFTGTAVLVRPVGALIVLIGGMLFLRYGPRRQGAWLVLAAMLACSFAPVYLWTERNQREMNFDGVSDSGGTNAWAMLAARVTAQVNGQDKWAVHDAFLEESDGWGLSPQGTNDEQWRRSLAIFREHPIVTAYCFLLSAAEQTMHPAWGLLKPAKLDFRGDFLVFTVLWGSLLVVAYLGWRSLSSPAWNDGSIDRGWLLTMLTVCLLLTLSSGLSFGNGSRLRLPLELIVPLFAAIGVARMMPMASDRQLPI